MSRTLIERDGITVGEFAGAAGVGPCLQITTADGRYVQLTKPLVRGLVIVFIKWLGGGYR